MADKLALQRAVESNDLDKASLLIDTCVDVNTRVIDHDKLQDAHDQLLSTVTANDLNAISVISIAYDVTVAIVYAVCLIACEDYVKPEMTFLHVWEYAKQELFSTVSLCSSFLQQMTAVTHCTNDKLRRLQVHLKENGVLSVANARYASKTFGALFEWILCVLAVSVGHPIIHLASSPEMIKVLAGAGNLHVDACDEFGYSKLALACKEDSSDLVECLLSVGANPILPVQPVLVTHSATDDSNHDIDTDTNVPIMPKEPFERVEECRVELGSVEALNVIPAMLQYTLKSNYNTLQSFNDCTHEDESCRCGEVPPPACVLLLSALFFVLSIEIVVCDNDGNPCKKCRGSNIYILTLKEIFDMIKLNSRFIDMLRVKFHHFKVDSLSSDDVDTLESFFDKYPFCFEVLNTTDCDEKILKYLLEEDDDIDNFNYDAERSFGSQTRSSHRLDSLSKVITGKGYSKRVAAAGDKKEIFQLFKSMSNFLDEVVGYRLCRGFERPVFLAKSVIVCEMILKHRDFDLDVYIDHHLYNGAPVLHHAVMHGHIGIVNLLLKLGAFVNARTYEANFTPLHILMNIVSPIKDRKSCERASVLAASRLESSFEDQSDMRFIPYTEDSVLLDLGSDVKTMGPSVLNISETETSANNLQHYSAQRGSGSEIDADGDPRSETFCHVGLRIAPPEVVISHITRSDRNKRDINFVQLRSGSSDNDDYSEDEKVDDGEEVDENILRISNILLQAGADISSLDYSGFTPFAMVQHTHPKLFQTFQNSAALTLTPIHLALITHMPDQELLNVIDQHINLVSKPTQRNKLPLHLALEFGRSVTVVSCLLKHFPGACRVSMARQRKKTVVKVVDCQKKSYDEIYVEHQLPFYYAVEKKMCDALLQELLSYSLPVNIFANADEVADIFGHHYQQRDPPMYENCSNHGFVWTWVLDQNSDHNMALNKSSDDHTPTIRINSQTQIALVKHIAVKFVRLIDGLVYAKNRNGKYAVAIATPACRRILLENLYFMRRYEIYRGTPLHVSPNCLVLLARDRLKDLRALSEKYATSDIWHNGFLGNGGGRLVVLKFMKYADSWYREVSTRKYERILEYESDIQETKDDGIVGELVDVETNDDGEVIHGSPAKNVQVYDNFNLDPTNWSTGLDEDGEGFRWYFNKMTYETWWHRPHCLGKLSPEEIEADDRAISGDSEGVVVDKGIHHASSSLEPAGNNDVMNGNNSIDVSHTVIESDDVGVVRYSINKNNVLSILHAFNAAKDDVYCKEYVRKGFCDYKAGVVVLPYCEKSLDEILVHENLSYLFQRPHLIGQSLTLDNNVNTNVYSSELKGLGVYMDWELILKIIRDVLIALEFLHSEGTVHCDIRPQNILRVRGKYVLVDFDRSSHLKLEDHVQMRNDLEKTFDVTSDPENWLCYSISNLCEQISPYSAPELIHKDLLTSEPLLRVIEPTRDNKPFNSVIKGKSVQPASCSIDMWSVGVLLYRLCTNVDLFQTDLSCGMNNEQVSLLSTWSDDIKWKKLSKVENQLARNLLWRLLHKDPTRRPTAKEALEHPFLLSQISLHQVVGESGQSESHIQTDAPESQGLKHRLSTDLVDKIPNNTRRELLLQRNMFLPPNKKVYDIVLSCGCDVDSVHAGVLFNMLTAKGFKVFWHGSRGCITRPNSLSEHDVSDDERYCDSLSQCHVFLPLLSFRVLDCYSYDALHVGGKVTRQNSRKAIDPKNIKPFVPQCKETPWDNFLFGLRYGIELKELGILEAICPIVIGEKDETSVLYEGDGKKGPTPGSRYLPQFLTWDEAVEEKVKYNLEKGKLGTPVRRNVNQIDTIPFLLKQYPGIELRGKIENGYKRVIEGVSSTLGARSIDRPQKEKQTGGGGGSAGVRGTIGALEERIKDQDIAIESLEMKFEKQAAELKAKTDELNDILATKNEDFKEFNRMKEALTRAKLKILDLKTGGKGNDDDPDDSASNESDNETDSSYENEKHSVDSAENQEEDDVRSEKSAAVISSWLSGLGTKED